MPNILNINSSAPRHIITKFSKLKYGKNFESNKRKTITKYLSKYLVG
jgi:hypothetical protein